MSRIWVLVCFLHTCKTSLKISLSNTLNVYLHCSELCRQFYKLSLTQRNPDIELSWKQKIVQCLELLCIIYFTLYLHVNSRERKNATTTVSQSPSCLNDSPSSNSRHTRPHHVSDSPEPGCSDWPSPATRTQRQPVADLQETSDGEDLQEKENTDGQ